MEGLKLAPYIGDGNNNPTDQVISNLEKFETSPVYRGRKLKPEDKLKVRIIWPV